MAIDFKTRCVTEEEISTIRNYVAKTADVAYERDMWYVICATTDNFGMLCISRAFFDDREDMERFVSVQIKYFKESRQRYFIRTNGAEYYNTIFIKEDK